MPRAVKTVALVDDHPIVLDGLEAVLHGIDGFEVVVTAQSGARFIEQLRDIGHVDLAVVDLRMPEMDGFAVLRWLKQERPGTRAVAFSFSNDMEWVQQAMDAGAWGYILKDSGGKEVRAVLNEVLDEGVQRPVLVQDDDGQASANGMRPLDIPEREFAFLVHVCDSKDRTYDQIADLMGVSKHSVDKYFRYFSKRFGIRSRAGLVAFATEQGWWKPPVAAS